MLFWVKAPCGLVGKANVSEKHALYIFRAKYGALTQKNNNSTLTLLIFVFMSTLLAFYCGVIDV
jgi:hypothetical protein